MGIERFKSWAEEHGWAVIYTEEADRIPYRINYVTPLGIMVNVYVKTEDSFDIETVSGTFGSNK
jgi:hypothetical protein